MRHLWSGKPSRRWLTRVGGAAVVLVLVATASPAAQSALAAGQSTTGKMTLGEHLELLASVGKNYLSRLRPEVLERFSTGGQKLLTLAELDPEIDDLAEAASEVEAVETARVQGPRETRPGFANDVFAAEDLFSRMAGMTQSETSAAWCRDNAVIGFNDSGSFVATSFLALSPSGSLSFNGYSRSTDAGGSYTDQGALIADPIPPELEFRDLLGDPVLGCTGRRDFYYASLAVDTGPGASFVNSGISVSRSVDGGATFGPAVLAAAKDGNLHFLDKPWFAVEPGPTGSPADDVLHVSYTDFDSSGLEGIGPCPDGGRTAIEYVRSVDGGQTWSEPLVIEEVCDSQGLLQGSQVEFGVGEEVYVGWEAYPFEVGGPRELRIRRSTDLGASFEATSAVGTVTGVGDDFALQGGFRNFLDLQGLAVDQSGGARRGTVYLTFQDGSARQKPDPLGFCTGTATYCFSDVYLTSSTDGGASWSSPVRINDDDVRLGVDQWFPAVDVDRSGTVWTTFHDRRRDERNLLIDTFVASSRDGGATWKNVRVTEQAFPPITGWQDVVVNPAYMGDYIAVAADSVGRHPGVILAWGDNGLGDANVVQRRVRG